MRSPFITLCCRECELQTEKVSGVRKVWLLIRQNSIHQHQTLPILLGSPIVPWILAEMEVAKHGKFEGTVLFELKLGFGRVGVEGAC